MNQNRNLLIHKHQIQHIPKADKTVNDDAGEEQKQDEFIRSVAPKIDEIEIPQARISMTNLLTNYK